jgi:hypothetical protein
MSVARVRHRQGLSSDSMASTGSANPTAQPFNRPYQRLCWSEGISPDRGKRPQRGTQNMERLHSGDHYW